MSPALAGFARSAGMTSKRFSKCPYRLSAVAVHAALDAGGRHGGGARGGLRRGRGDRRRRRARALAALLLLDHAQARDVLLVLVKIVGEDVPAGAVGDEEDLLGARRIGGGLERSAARIGDRPGRQALDHV